MISPELIDVVLPENTGYPLELAAKDTDEAIWDAMGDTAREFPNSLYVEPSEVRERADYNDKHGLWAEDYWDRFTNQSPTHECTTHAGVSVMEACWNRQRRICLGGPVAGERKPISEKSASVWFSCISVYCEANPGQWGGANVREILNIAVERGFLPDDTQPRDYGFRHTFPGTCGKGGINQSRTGTWPGWSGGTFRRLPSSWPDDNWRETAKHFRPLECVIPQSTAQYDSLLIHGFSISIGRSGHSVPIGRIVYDGGRKLYRYRDSYDVFRYDSRAYPSGSYSIITCTQPDDWDRPAG